MQCHCMLHTSKMNHINTVFIFSHALPANVSPISNDAEYMIGSMQLPVIPKLNNMSPFQFWITETYN